MDKLPFFEVEELLDSLKALNEKEEEERKKSEGKKSSSVPNFDVNAMARKMSSSSGMHLPSLPNFKL